MDNWEYFRIRIEEIVCNRCMGNEAHCDRCEKHGDISMIRSLIKEMREGVNNDKN